MNKRTAKITCILFILLSFLLILTTNAYLKKRSLINLNRPVNSTGDDFSPSVTEDGTTMVFNSRGKNKPDHDIYISYLKNGTWSNPVALKEINSPDNDETPFISADGTVLVFSSDRKGSALPSVTSDKKVRITYDIYISKKNNGTWSKPVRIPGEVNTGRNERTPSLSTDKRFLYFTRFPFRSLKYAKIMQATYSGGKYIDVTQMPYPINSKNFDVSLRPAINDKGFYFSSMRPGGHGGWDIYYVPYNNGKYGDAVNMGSSINSGSHEMFLSETRSAMFLCSNRINSIGKYDIYTIKKDNISLPKPSEPVSTVKPEIPDQIKTIKETNRPEKATKASGTTKLTLLFVNRDSAKPVPHYPVTVYLKESGNPKTPAKRSIKKTTDRFGRIIVLPKKDINYIVIKPRNKIMHSFRKQVRVKHGYSKDVTIDVATQTGKEKQPVFKKSMFKPVHFSSDSSTIRFSSYPYLHQIISYLRKNRNVHMMLEGHADLEGSTRYNMQLSIKRARSVYNYFIKMGINKYRLQYKGMGEKEPVINRKGKGNNKYNRRVEFKIISR